MIVVVGDTHGRRSHHLPDALLSIVRDASHVIHTGDFITENVLDAFQSVSDTLVAVYGNNDSPEVRDRVPEKCELSMNGFRMVVVHGHTYSNTSLSYLGQESDADLVIFGHSHSPQVIETDDVVLFNPGSYATPRQFTPAYGILHADDTELSGALKAINGELLDSFSIGKPE